MSKEMRPQAKKINIDPSATKPYQITLLSPGIDDNSTLLSTTASVTPDKNTLKKKIVPETRKVPKIDHGKKFLIPKKRFSY